jgi:hypothetical protein
VSLFDFIVTTPPNSGHIARLLPYYGGMTGSAPPEQIDA